MNTPEKCFYCEIKSNDVPLFKMTFKGNELYVCPQHVPLLIHDPAKLTGKLEGSENLKPYEAD